MRLKCLIILCVHRMKFLIFLGYEINTCKFEVSCKNFFMYVACLPFSISWQEGNKKGMERFLRLSYLEDSCQRIWAYLKEVSSGIDVFREGQVLKWTEHEGQSATDLPWLHPQGVRENSLLDLLQAEQHCEFLFFDFFHQHVKVHDQSSIEFWPWWEEELECSVLLQPRQCRDQAAVVFHRHVPSPFSEGARKRFPVLPTTREIPIKPPRGAISS